MKVVVAHQYLYGYHMYGGAEKYFYFLSKSLAQSGVDVEYVTSHLPGLSDFTSHGVKFKFLLPSIKSWYPFMGARESYIFSYKLAKHLEKRDFDLLHTAGGTLYILRKNRKPVVSQLFSMESLDAYGLKRVYYTLIGHYALLKRVVKLADALAVEDPVQEEKLISFYSKADEKIFYLPCGVDLSRVDEILASNELSPRVFDSNKGSFTIVSVNRFDRRKGIRYLVDAFRIVRQQIPYARLVLVGQGPEEPRILKMVKALGIADSVEFHKNLRFEDLIQHYAEADVYVSPVLHKTTVGSILEAMGCGLPIVSTGQEWWTHNGENGYIVPPRNANAIAEAVLKMYDKNEFKKMGKVSRHMVENYDWRIIAKNAIDAYQRLV